MFKDFFITDRNERVRWINAVAGAAVRNGQSSSCVCFVPVSKTNQSAGSDTPFNQD